MRITKVEALILQAPEDGRPHWVSHFIVPRANELLIQLHTDEDISGFGLAPCYTTVEPVVNAVKAGVTAEVLDCDPLAPERIYEKLFSMTSARLAHERGWSRDALIKISAAVDLACWDILGKAAGLPLYRLFGGYRDEVPCYVTCAYYRDGKDKAELRDEIESLKEQGHTGFKAKVGGLTVEEDVERLEIVRDVIGEDCHLMIDANRAWDLQTATQAAYRMAHLRPNWLEEPVRWHDDRRELKVLSQRTNIPLSAGESELTRYGCRALIEDQAVQILQFDCTMFGGFTHGRKLAALCEMNHVQIAPHHDCFFHAPLVAASPSGLIVESFTDPERDPLQAELFENSPAIKDGWLKLNPDPGLGLTLSEKALKKYGRTIAL